MPDRGFHHGHLREALIEAGRAAVEEGHADALSLRDLARRVGVTPTAAYRHFASRADLLLAIATTGFDDLARDFAEAGDAPPRGRLLALGLAYIRFARTRPSMFALMFATPWPEGVPEIGATPFRMLCEAVAALTGADPGDPAVEDAATRLWALVHGIAALRLAGHLPGLHDEEALRALLAQALPAEATPTAGTPPRATPP